MCTTKLGSYDLQAEKLLCGIKKKGKKFNQMIFSCMYFKKAFGQPP